jgi:ATP-dependent Lon protease
VPDNVKTGRKIVPVSTVGEVLKVALVRQPEAIDWIEPEVVAPVGLPDTEDPVVTH